MNVRRAHRRRTTLRALRLQALADAPDAFGSTYERELARTVDDWRRWLSPGATFILEDRLAACGLVACARDAADATIVHLMAMWVAPAARGSGAADALVNQVIAWARADGARVVRLQVVEDNVRARRLYERHGFRVTGVTRVRERDGAVELDVERVLDEPPLIRPTVAAQQRLAPARPAHCAILEGVSDPTQRLRGRAQAGWPPSGRRASKAPGSTTGATSSPHPPPKSGDLSADRRTTGRCTFRRGRPRRARRCRRCRCASRATTRSSTSDPARAASCSWRQNTRSDGSSAWSRLASCTRPLERNIQRYRHRARRCPWIEAVHARAQDYAWPADPLVLFFFNPFPADVMAQVMQRVARSLEQHPRPIWLILLFPELAPIIQAVTTLRLHQQTRRLSHLRQPARRPVISTAV